MNPTANKSDFDDLATNLKDLAYSYLEKYSPSNNSLKFIYLKIFNENKRNKKKKEVSDIIDKIILHLEKNKILNEKCTQTQKLECF